MVNKNNRSVTACHGDSGGPVIWEDKNDQNRAYLMGIVSRGDGGCGKGDPAKPRRDVWIKKLSKWLILYGDPEIEKCLP